MYDIDFNIKGQLKLHTRKFLLFPQFWNDDDHHIDLDLNWQQVKFTEENIAAIPDQYGLYCFVVKPEVPHFFETRYLFYVGETQRTLKIRYGEYLRDQKGLGKPRSKIYEMLNLYKDYIHFFFAEIDNLDDVEENEDKLLNTFVPSINSRIPKAKIMPELQNIYE